MGIVVSLISKKVKRFNVENRAHRVLEREKPVAAPKYKSNLIDMERTMELDPNFFEKLHKKDNSLNERLKNVYVTSEDRFIDYKLIRSTPPAEKTLPLDRHTADDFEFGYMEPEKVTIGRCTLRQALKFITDHQGDPEKYTKLQIAEDYKMKPELVENILKYFRSYSAFIPEKTTKDSILVQARNKLLPDKNKD